MSVFSKTIANTLPYFPKKLIWRFSKRYIAGETIDDAILVTRVLNNQGITTTIDILGEYIVNLQQAKDNLQQYLSLIKTTVESNIDCSYSVKPSSFGMLLDKNFCLNAIEEVIKFAMKHNRFITVDMEDSTCTTDEFEIFKKLYSKYPANVGIVIQAYLKRSQKDMQDLIRINNPEAPVNIRICKGIYIESEDIAHKNPDAIRLNYVALLEQCIKGGLKPAIATHDHLLVDKAIQLIEKYQLSKTSYEFQMLYGVLPNYRNQLVNSGYPMRIYVPYGKDWFKYSVRRLKENPKLVPYIVKETLGLAE